MNSFESLVSLNLIPQIGSGRLCRLLGRFGNAENIFSAGLRELEEVAGDKTAREIVSFDKEKLDRELSWAGNSGLRIITFLDKDYPPNLKEIPGFPPVLYVSGDIVPADSLSVGIVGSRAASLYGLSSAEKFSAELASCGLTVVSGMARGVDTYAHRGALRARGRTIAVMGSGFGHIYPQENRGLAEKISENGAVISEFPMDTKPLAQNFPRRNRLISGLSLGILVTEAAKNSGALITVDFALEQGREVFALPGRIDTNTSAGTNEIIKQGARLVTCSQEIIEELNLGVYSAPEKEKYGAACAGEENRLYGLIGRDAVSIDELTRNASLPVNRVAELVLRLRCKRLIRELPGKLFTRS
jgi:DNA processing protein